MKILRKTESLLHVKLPPFCASGAVALFLALVARIVQSVQHFLEDPSVETISLGIKSMWWLALIGVVIVLFAAQILLDRAECIIDKGAQRVTLKGEG